MRAPNATTHYGACEKFCHLHFYQLRSTGCEKRLNARTDTFLCTLWKQIQCLLHYVNLWSSKCWKRHRDVPTSIDQLVDRAVEDLERRRKDLTLRMKKNKIKIQPLEKIENLLLHCCFEVAENFPDECGPDMQTLKTKLKTMKQDQETVDARVQRTQMRFLALREKGILIRSGTDRHR